MVSILPSERGPLDVLGKGIGNALQGVFPGAVQQGLNRGQLQQSLGNIAKIAQDPNASPLDTLLAVMQAGAGIPGSERYLATLGPELVKFAQAKRSQGIPLPGEQSRMHEAPEQMARQQQQQLPGFLGQEQPQKAQFFPTNVGPQGGPGNLPQAATAGEKRSIPNRSEMIDKARDLAHKSTEAGIPLTVPQALDQVKQQVEEDKNYNNLIEQERKERVVSQKEYGQRAAEQLKKLYPEATDEQEAVFAKKGEEIASGGKSEADINRAIAKEATKFKNAIANVEKDLSAPRLYNAPTRLFSGNYKNLEKSGEDIRKHLEPLLNLGLYDTSRKLLQKKGYGPEETDFIINPLNERSKSLVAPIPRQRGEAFGKAATPKEINDVKDILMQMKEAENNFSLVLARKAFEDKGYDWRSFKDAFNEAQKEGLKLTDDQGNQQGLLDHPPLNVLDKILHNLNLTGR